LSISYFQSQLAAVKEKVELAAQEAEMNKKAAIAKSQQTEPPKDVADGIATENEISAQLNAATVQVCKILIFKL